MSELTETLNTLAAAVKRNPDSIKTRLIRNQLKATYGMTDAQIDSELKEIA